MQSHTARAREHFFDYDHGRCTFSSTSNVQMHKRVSKRHVVPCREIFLQCLKSAPAHKSQAAPTTLCLEKRTRRPIHKHNKQLKEKGGMLRHRVACETSTKRKSCSVVLCRHCCKNRKSRNKQERTKLSIGRLPESLSPLPK